MRLGSHTSSGRQRILGSFTSGQFQAVRMDGKLKRNVREAFQYEDDDIEQIDDRSLKSIIGMEGASSDESERERAVASPREAPADADFAAVESAGDELSIDELLAESDALSQRGDDEAAAESDFTETWAFDSNEELLAPEEMFSSEDLKGKT